VTNAPASALNFAEFHVDLVAGRSTAQFLITRLAAGLTLSSACSNVAERAMISPGRAVLTTPPSGSVVDFDEHAASIFERRINQLFTGARGELGRLYRFDRSD
jgi:hypothetical protein